MAGLASLEGVVFNRLTVVKRAPSTDKGTRWLCRCTCGKDVDVSRTALVRGYSQSCGCMRNENTGNRRRKHGEANTSGEVYGVWQAMKRRCNNTATRGYRYYGARGIRVCARWSESYEAFRDDMGPRSEGMSIERIDNDGDYCPENCRWATQAEQIVNRRNNRMVVMGGQSITETEASRMLGLSTGTVAACRRAGWAEDRLLAQKASKALGE